MIKSFAKQNPIVLHSDSVEDTSNENESIRVKTPFNARLDSFISASIILSFLDYRGHVERILKQLNKNSRAYLIAHGQMLKNVLVEAPTLRRQKA